MATRQPAAVAAAAAQIRVVLPPAVERSTDPPGRTYRSASPAISGPSTAAGATTRVASRAARPANCRRAAPRARSSAVCGRRSSCSSAATSTSAYPPSTRMSSSGVASDERPTRSARAIRSSSCGIFVTACPELPSWAASGTAAAASVRAFRTAGRSAVSTPPRSGWASQDADTEPGKVAAKSAGSSVNGPYEVPETGAARPHAGGQQPVRVRRVAGPPGAGEHQLSPSFGGPVTHRDAFADGQAQGAGDPLGQAHLDGVRPGLGPGSAGQLGVAGEVVEGGQVREDRFVGRYAGSARGRRSAPGRCRNGRR